MKLVAIAMALVATGCPSQKAKLEEAVATMEAFAEKMCSCKDKDCADKVTEEITRWSTKMAASSSAGGKASDEHMTRMTSAATKYGECMTKLVGAPAVDPLTQPPAALDVPPPAKNADADVLMRSALAFARTKYPQHLPVSITIYYADSNGMLDDTHGKLYASFGRAALSGDDPTRKTGAPVVRTATHSDCFGFSWDREHGWTKLGQQCEQAYEAGVRCSVREIWKRGIAGGAPADALATLAITLKPGTRAWGFWITDEPRNVDINQGFEDDCPMAVEK